MTALASVRSEDTQSDETDEFVVAWETANGTWHRQEGPAILARNVGTFSETYMLDGKLHRDGGPAVLEMDYDTGAMRVFWYLDGKLHREDGPAVVVVSAAGLTERREWWHHGELVSADVVS